MCRLCLSATLVLVLGAEVASAFPKEDTRRDIKKVGGTILVYEVDAERSPGGTFSLEDLARALKQRLDPAALNSLRVRPEGKSRIEIVLPRGPGDHKKDVERVKNLLQRIGSLEFRIVANKHDDDRAIQAATTFFKKTAKSWHALLPLLKGKWPAIDKSVAAVSVGDRAGLTALIRKHYPKESMKDVAASLNASLKASPELRELMQRAQAGLPPPPPRAADGKAFTIALEDGRHQVSYAWVELGRSELAELKLEDASSKEKPWKAADRARRDGLALDSAAIERLGFDEWTSLLYSRPAQAGQRQKYAYFVLTRNPEPGKAVTGAFLEQIKEGKDARGAATADFRLNKKGAKLLGELTTANRPPRDGGHRLLAVILDGQVMTTPSLNAVIREAGQISGKFSRAEIEALVTLLRSGALPATLKPQPVNEKIVPPSKNGD